MIRTYGVTFGGPCGDSSETINMAASSWEDLSTMSHSSGSQELLCSIFDWRLSTDMVTVLPGSGAPAHSGCQGRQHDLVADHSAWPGGAGECTGH